MDWETLRQRLQDESLIKTRRQVEKWFGVVVAVLILLFIAYVFGRVHQVDRGADQIKALNAQLDILTQHITILDDSAKVLAAQRDSARKASAKTKAAVIRGREQVRVISPGVLEVRTTPTSELQHLNVDSLVTAALAAERHRVDSLENELDIAALQDSVDSTGIAERDEKIAVLEEKVEVLKKKAECKILWLVSCPSRKQAAAIGAGAVVVGAVAVKAIIIR